MLVKAYTCFRDLDSHSFFLSPHSWLIMAPELNQLQSSLHGSLRLGYVLWPPQVSAGKGDGGVTQKELPHQSQAEGRRLSHSSPICRQASFPEVHAWWYMPGGSVMCFVGGRERQGG